MFFFLFFFMFHVHWYFFYSLHLKEEAHDFLEENTLKDLIKKYSQFINFNIYIWSSKVSVHIVHIRHLWQQLQLKWGALYILCDKVCQWLAAGQWFSPGPPVSSTNITDCHDITEILLKVALNTITSNPRQWIARIEYKSQLIFCKCKCNVAWGLSVCNALYIGNIWVMGFVATFYNIILLSFCLKLYGWQVFEKKEPPSSSLHFILK
jgi:hypothetical protein